MSKQGVWDTDILRAARAASAKLPDEVSRRPLSAQTAGSRSQAAISEGRTELRR